MLFDRFGYATFKLHQLYKCKKNNILKIKKSKTYKNLGFLWVLRDSNP